MTLKEYIHEYSNTSSISNVSTRGQPIISSPCKKDIKGSIKNAISENPSFKQFLEKNNAYGRYVKNITNQILQSRNTYGRDTSDKLTRYINKIAHSGYNNREIISNTISWVNTSEGIDYWSGLYSSTKK